MKAIICIGILLVAATISWPVHAQAVPPPETNGEPVEVDISISIEKIYGIDGMNETFQIDGYLTATWHDPRQATGRFIKYVNEQATAVLVDTVWSPVLEYINIVGDPDIPNLELNVYGDGRVEYIERFSGRFMSPMDFRKYPFDRQTFRLKIESFSYESNVVALKPSKTHMPDDARSYVEWEFDEQPMVSAAPHAEIGVDTTWYYSRYELSVGAARQPGYYLWQFFLPLLLIVAASMSVFWIPDFSNRLQVAFMLMLTVVAYNFYTSTLLPKLPYNTFIEAVVTSGYVTIFLTIILILVIREREGSPDGAASRIVRACRILFPLSYAVALIVLALVFMTGN